MLISSEIFNTEMKPMPIEGYVEYKKREFCHDVKCSVQLALDSQNEGSEKYEEIRQTCKTDCKYSAWEFHHWLISKGYLIVKPVR
jgi:hypothetical protein